MKLDQLISELFPGATIEGTRSLGSDSGEDKTTEKAGGYGKPVRVAVVEPSGERHDLVLHTAASDDFGHDRRSDRAEEWLLAYDTFGEIPLHAPPLDVGFIESDGTLRSVRSSGEFYLLTRFVPGTLYAEDLRHIASSCSLSDRDRDRCGRLARYLAELHEHRGGRPAVYRRAIRDLVGHGEGIFGLIDAFPDDVPAAPLERLRSLERRCVDWRWRLRGKERRITLSHGDFHPFNILFSDADELALLDASRGCHGDPADDVICLAMNFVFFSAAHEGAWHGGLGELWQRFWDEYMAQTGDEELFEVAPPFVAWRALVMAHPGWYPNVTAATRDALLTLVEKSLDAGYFNPDSAQAVAVAK
jgi:hypothetical protein